MDNQRIEFTPEVIAQQRAICDAATPGGWYYVDNGFDGYVASSSGGTIFGGEPGEGRIEPDDPDASFVIAAKAGYRAALDALEAAQKELSAQRIAFQKLYGNHQRGISPKVIACPVCGGVECVRLVQRKDAPELFGLTCGECGGHATIQLFADPDELTRLTAERDAEKKRADAVPEIDIRPLQPGYMGVCTTDDEDGIQIRKVSHKHPQGRGYLDDDEDVQDVVVIRFADTAQVLAVVDRLLVLADAMAEKTRTTSANTDAPTGAESRNE